MRYATERMLVWSFLSFIGGMGMGMVIAATLGCA
jgi:hypothetical protein|tara:strand:+ start:94 stop:195 length:102 start_codon:yes stop_codon:yes gene_type:complete